MKLEELNAKALNLITFLFGFGFILISILIGVSKPIGVVLISIGTSIVASSIVVYLSSKYLFKQNKIKDIIEQWGLINIYRTRAEMNLSCNLELDKVNDRIDIIAFGLKGFRERHSTLITQKVKRGLKIRIISINPNSNFLMQREKDENEIEGQIKNTIIKLNEWIDELKTHQVQLGQVQIKFYDTLPFDFYFRIDNNIFIGPYLYGVSSQQTISFEFSNNSQGFEYYTTYFESIWNDTNLLRNTY